MTEGPTLSWLRRIYSEFSAKFADKDAAGRQPVTAHSDLGIDLAAGRIFTSGGAVALTAGQQGSIYFQNPIGSGKIMTIYGFTARHDQTSSLRISFLENPVRSGGTLRTGFNHDLSSSVAAEAEVYTGQGILTGGTTLDLTTRAVRDEGFRYQGPPLINIIEGAALAMRVTAPGGLGATADCDFSVVWREV